MTLTPDQTRLSQEVHQMVDEHYTGWHGWVSRDGEHPGWVYAVAEAAPALPSGTQATVFARTPQQIGGAIERYLWQRDRGVA